MQKQKQKQNKKRRESLSLLSNSVFRPGNQSTKKNECNYLTHKILPTSFQKSSPPVDTKQLVQIDWRPISERSRGIVVIIKTLVFKMGEK